jgi:hypothetical protein
MQSFFLVLFAIAAGFTLSGIVANLYRICGFDPETRGGSILRLIVLIFAGPIVVIEAALRGRAKKEWTATFFWLVAAGMTYWSLALGLLVLDVAISL